MNLNILKLDLIWLICSGMILERWFVYLPPKPPSEPKKHKRHTHERRRRGSGVPLQGFRVGPTQARNRNRPFSSLPLVTAPCQRRWWWSLQWKIFSLLQISFWVFFISFPRLRGLEPLSRSSLHREILQGYLPPFSFYSILLFKHIAITLFLNFM